MFDYDGSGTVSLDEFSRGLKRRNLEPLFSREQQRVLFQHIDKDGNEELDVHEFMQFLDEPGPLDSSRSTMSRFGRPPPKKKDRKMHPAVQRVKDMIVDRLVARRRFHKFDDDQKVNSEYLVQVFKQWDEGLSGYLTPDEFCDALGEKHMNLGVSKRDMQLVLEEIDSDHNGEISYKEFAKFVQVHDIDPEYNPFFDSRQRALNKLGGIANKKWEWQKETDLANENVKKMAESIAKDVKTKEEYAKKEKEREVASIPKETNMMKATRPHTVGSSTDRSGGKTGGKLAPENMKQKLKKLNTSHELFDEMKQKKAEQLAAICPRFMALPPTDWTRTGCGGNGVDPRSAGYKPFNQNTTTTNDYYPPIIYVPNQPVARNLMSDSQKGFLAKKQSAYKRKKRTDNNFKIIMDRVKMEETMQRMNEDQKLKEKGTSMLNYFSAIYAADAKLQKKESGNGLLKKAHPKFAHRMWGGDTRSPFHISNLHNESVVFRKTSSDYGSHSLRRSAKPGTEGGGGGGGGGGGSGSNQVNREHFKIKKNINNGLIE